MIPTRPSPLKGLRSFLILEASSLSDSLEVPSPRSVRRGDGESSAVVLIENISYVERRRSRLRKTKRKRRRCRQ